MLLLQEFGLRLYRLALFGHFLPVRDGAPVYVQRPEPVVEDPTGLRPLLGYELADPYVLERR